MTPAGGEKISASGFAASLPEEYRERFGPAEIAAHAHTFVMRSPGEAAAGIFPWYEPGLTAICVSVEDRPGLLSLISRSLNEVGFEVESAEAYCRDGDPRVAVDFFWLRDPSGRIGQEDVQAFVEILNGVLSGLRPEAPVGLPVPGAPSSVRNTTVRFLEQRDGALSVLEVETEDRSGLLWSITRALHGAGVQIVGSQIRTTGARVLDRFTIAELDGSSIADERRFAIQVAILSALEV
jgi:UTP:GlnB (protein PII) uridylyltransferase